jgi:N-formylglutamate amidohydrolase
MDQTIPGVLTLTEPTATPVPLVFDSPHSGTQYPADFKYDAPEFAIRSAEDMYVEELYAAAPENGAPLLVAHFPRSYIDPNRSELEIDPELLAEPWPEPLDVGEKAKFGQGVIWRVYPPGLPIYERKLSLVEVRNRIEFYHRPYHAAIKGVLDRQNQRFGRVWHINCHSTPSVSSDMSPEGPGIPRADFVLGDRDGTTCASEFTALVRDTLERFGYDVKLNDPYKGGELLRAYSDPAAGRHSLQIEIARRLYMDEQNFERHDGFAELRENITQLIRTLRDYASSEAT